jgi:hypothetical protein
MTVAKIGIKLHAIEVARQFARMLASYCPQERPCPFGGLHLGRRVGLRDQAPVNVQRHLD